MDLWTAWTRLARENDPAAAEICFAMMDDVSSRIGLPDHVRKDIRDDIFLRILQKLNDGTLAFAPPPGAEPPSWNRPEWPPGTPIKHDPRGYAARAMKNRSIERHRQRAREADMTPAVARHVDARTAEAPIGAEALEPTILDQLHDVHLRAVRRRTYAVHREPIERAWRELVEMHVHGHTLRDVLLRDDPSLGANAAALRRAEQSAHKRHQRARRDMHDVIDGIAHVRPEEGEILRHALDRYFRRRH
jgi:hypothetical protein